MENHYETYAYVDLGELSSEAVEDTDREASADAATSCRGKVLLLLTTNGMEIVRVPTRLH